MLYLLSLVPVIFCCPSLVSRIDSLLYKHLAIEVGTGIAVIVLCFVDKNSQRNIQDKLGNGLTRVPFAVIVVSGL
jgi:hypothetical protein